MKKNIKIILLIVTVLLVTNVITYKLTYDYIDMKSFILHTKLDVNKLKAYDRNDTKYLDIVMNGGIDSILHDAGKTGDTEKYRSLCQDFDKELFEVLDKYLRKNIERYGLYKDIELQNIRLNIEKGIVNMKKSCLVP